jgi:heme A synthase
VAGGSLIAFAGRDVRSRIRFLALWTPAVSLWISCGFFFAASQVTCTYTCPVPYGATFDWQDFGHTLFATCAFIVACWAMLQAAFAQGHRVLALFSLVMGAAVGAIAAVGGILALARFQVGFGSRLELVATSLAIAWVAVYGVVIAARRMRDSDRRSDGDQRRDMRSSSSVASPTST